MDLATQVQILNKAVCISYYANTFAKGMNPTVLSTTMGKLKSRLGSLTSVWQLVVERENSEFKPVVDLERDEFSQAIPAQDKLYD